MNEQETQRLAALKQKQKQLIAEAVASTSPQQKQGEKQEAKPEAKQEAKPEAKQEKDIATPMEEDKKDEQDKKEKKKDEKKAPAAKREKRSVGDFYNWKSEADVMGQFRAPFGDQDFEALRQRLQSTAKAHNVTVEDVLKLTANTMNQREADKLAQIAQKQIELREAAEAALATLFARAQIDNAQRAAKELKQKLLADRKQQ